MTDPSAIRSLAISSDDLIAATEADARGTAPVVLRVTPPYSGRMRARLHVARQPSTDDETIHVRPPELLRASAPPFPTPDRTEDELRRAEDGSYTVDRHRTYHEQQVKAWRASLPEYVVDSVVLPAVGHEVRIALLGT